MNAQRNSRFSSEGAVRAALERRRRRQPASPAGSADRGLPSAGTQPRPLRRWSVAELVARATARPPSGGLAH